MLLREFAPESFPHSTPKAELLGDAPDDGLPGASMDPRSIPPGVKPRADSLGHERTPKPSTFPTCSSGRRGKGREVAPWQRHVPAVRRFARAPPERCGRAVQRSEIHRARGSGLVPPDAA